MLELQVNHLCISGFTEHSLKAVVGVTKAKEISKRGKNAGNEYKF